VLGNYEQIFPREDFMDKPDFKFGENWASFSKQLTEERLQGAMHSLDALFGEGNLKNKSFLDIGCGSGIFSIAAERLGADPVIGIDVDATSVAVSRENIEHWVDKPNRIKIHEASILDSEKMTALGKFDIAYSWGVLQFTGAMWRAIECAAQRVKPGGLLMIAIYNKHWTSPIWKLIKWIYNHIGKVGQRIMIWLFAPLIFLAKWLVTFKNPFKMRRGMDFMHNVIDWVGGYPYEYASIPDTIDQLEALGMSVVRLVPATVPTGCNEFICKISEEQR
jgi:SAM-dependent methyltransferase